MNEELIRKYQETITLLQFRMPGYTFYGDFVNSYDGKIAYRLTFFKESDGNGADTKRKIFKYMENSEKALWYFVKIAQNRFF
jgi:hypothetical protein